MLCVLVSLWGCDADSAAEAGGVFCSVTTVIAVEDRPRSRNERGKIKTSLGTGRKLKQTKKGQKSNNCVFVVGCRCVLLPLRPQVLPSCAVG